METRQEKVNNSGNESSSTSRDGIETHRCNARNNYGHNGLGDKSSDTKVNSPTAAKEARRLAPRMSHEWNKRRLSGIEPEESCLESFSGIENFAAKRHIMEQPLTTLRESCMRNFAGIKSLGSEQCSIR